MYELLASHDDGGTGVCNHHRSLTTVYSYVVSCRAGRTTLHVVQGQPCSSSKHVELDIPFGEHASFDSVAPVPSVLSVRHEAERCVRVVAVAGGGQCVAVGSTGNGTTSLRSNVNRVSRGVAQLGHVGHHRVAAEAGKFAM